MSSMTHEVSIKGKILKVPSIRLDKAVIITRGRFVRVAEIFDEYWIEADTIPDPHTVLRQLRDAGCSADLFTFAQRVPDTEPRFDFYMEPDNVAVVPISTHEAWFREQISSASRRNIRTSEKKGVVVRAVPFDESYVRGIKSIFDESPIRAGRRYWHYNKDLSAVEKENGTYRERSTFLGAFFQGELIGYMKIVWDVRSAAIMQVLSKMEFLDKRPNNALLSEAVRLCSERHIPYLLYERFVYGNKTDSSLTRFKRENGFVRMDLPRYYIPLCNKGELILRFGLQRQLKERLPQWLTAPLLELRTRWYDRGRNN